MLKISFIVGYYRNSGMLEYQLKTWKSYPLSVRQNFEFIVVDDGSPDMPAKDVITNKDGLRLSLYKIEKDLPWNQAQARNLGALKAAHDWVFFLDIDHIPTTNLMEGILKYKVKPKMFYTFGRQRVVSVSPLKLRKTHSSNCLFLINRHEFIDIGGYDEDFCGNYGYSDAWLKFRMDKYGMVMFRNEVLEFQCFHHSVIPQAQDMSRERDKKVNRKLYFNKISGRIAGNFKHLVNTTVTRVL